MHTSVALIQDSNGISKPIESYFRAALIHLYGTEAVARIQVKPNNDFILRSPIKDALEYPLLFAAGQRGYKSSVGVIVESEKVITSLEEIGTDSCAISEVKKHLKNHGELRFRSYEVDGHVIISPISEVSHRRETRYSLENFLIIAVIILLLLAALYACNSDQTTDKSSPEPKLPPGQSDAPTPPSGPQTPGQSDAPTPPTGPQTPGQSDAPTPPSGPQTPGQSDAPTPPSGPSGESRPETIKTVPGTPSPSEPANNVTSPPVVVKWIPLDAYKHLFEQNIYYNLHVPPPISKVVKKDITVKFLFIVEFHNGEMLKEERAYTYVENVAQ